MPSRTINSESPCKNLKEFLRFVQQVRSKWKRKNIRTRGDNKTVWFRGQRSENWDLRPRLYRKEFMSADESEVRLEFEGNGLQVISPEAKHTKWEWYFLMQHYGAPTRLLDWTDNPLIALYFSISHWKKGDGNDNAAVWVFDPWHWNKLHSEGLRGPALAGWEEAKPYLPDLEIACDGVSVEKIWAIAIEPPSIDSRLANQMARFLLFGKKKELVGLANRSDRERKDKKPSRLAKIVIAFEAFEDIRGELDDLGINERTLFPDLQGLGTHLSWKWKELKHS